MSVELLKDRGLWRTAALIDGAWVSETPHGTYTLRNPATGAVLVELPVCKEAETEAAIQAAGVATQSQIKMLTRELSKLSKKVDTLIEKKAPAKKAKQAPDVVTAKTAPSAGKESAIEGMLRAWRLAEAKRKGVPAFRILTDRALQAIAEKQPLSTRELLEVPGVGLTIVEKYGAQIFQIVERAK